MKTSKNFYLICVVCCFLWITLHAGVVDGQDCNFVAIQSRNVLLPNNDALYILKSHLEFQKISNVTLFNVTGIADLVQKVKDNFNSSGCGCISNLYIVGLGNPGWIQVGNDDMDISEVNKLWDLNPFMCNFPQSTVWLMGSHIGHCNDAPDFLYKLAQTLTAVVKAPVDSIEGGKMIDYMNNGRWQTATPLQKPSHKATKENFKQRIKAKIIQIPYYCPCDELPYEALQECINNCTVSLKCNTNICDTPYYTNNTWDEYSGNPVFAAGSSGSWDESGVSQPTVLKASPYAMWYAGWDSSGVESIGCATSVDGINWTRDTNNPVLSSGASGSWDDYGVYGPSVIKDGSTYKMWYTGYSQSAAIAQIGYATSADGINWTKDSNNPVLTVSSSGTWDAAGAVAPTVIKDGSTYKMWYGGRDAAKWWRIGYATSTDGINWTKDTTNNPVLSEGSSGSFSEWGVDAPSVVKDDSTYHMLHIGFDGSNVGSIGYATSSDGINWTESTTNPHFSRTYGDAFNTINVGHPVLLKDSNESVFEAFYRGKNDTTWAIGFGVAASLGGGGTASTTTTTPTGSTTIPVNSSTTTTTNGQTTFTLSGRVMGAVSANVIIELTGDAYQETTTESDGVYEFNDVASGGFYIVTPYLAGYTFEPPNYEIGNLPGDVPGLDFVSSRSSKCVPLKIYGEDSGEVELLRYFRDEVLHKTKEGKELIKLYYQWSPAIVKAMEEDEEFKEEMKETIDSILPLIDEVLD